MAMKKYKIAELPENIRKSFESVKGKHELLNKVFSNKNFDATIDYNKTYDNCGVNLICLVCYLVLGDYSAEYEIKHYVNTAKELDLMSPEIENELMPYIFGGDNENKL